VLDFEQFGLVAHGRAAGFQVTDLVAAQTEREADAHGIGEIAGDFVGDDAEMEALI
jgi:hypothetical protein